VDDFVLLLDLDLDIVMEKAQKVIDLLQLLGFVINQKKSMRRVAQQISFRGFV
jgi:hypothetical protein